MVHPLMRSSSGSPGSDEDPTPIADRIIALLPRLHVLVIGPGLGRDPLMHATCALVIRAARQRGMPLVLDADALLLVAKQPELVRGYGLAVLTPNVVEFARLGKALGVGEGEGVEGLARELGGMVVLQKGGVDRIAGGGEGEGGVMEVDLKGGRKRSGGQGDTLTGCVATFLAWRGGYHGGLWEEGGEGGRLKEEETVRLAVFGGSAVTRVSLILGSFLGGGCGDVPEMGHAAMMGGTMLTLIIQECSRLAFAKHGRSIQASDLTEQVHTAFLNIFGDVDDDKQGGKL